ncbi:Ribokinase-like protein [Cyathus striatus]|nr:Ribokinase-like protein [Cyathus striatus]
MAKAAERVLSIQSHVVFGYVGGKAAVFPLQCLGYDVDVVNTVNFSNHSGYGKTGGTKAQLQSSIPYSHPPQTSDRIHPGAEALDAVASLATRLKHAKPSMIYLLDPVMGDAGQIYVAPDVAELLTQIQLTDFESLRSALKSLHENSHVPNVVISSIPLKPWLLSFHAQVVPTIPGYFSGVGDLFSALILAHYHPDIHVEGSTPVSTAAAQALTKTHALLEITHEYALTLPEEERLPTDDELDEADPMRKTRRMRGRELLLIQGQDIIRGTSLDETKIRHLPHGMDSGLYKTVVERNI